MPTKISIGYLLLVIVQGLHSIEEYIGKLWDVFPPAKFLCSLVSNNLETGFIIINVGIFIVGMLAWFFPVRKNYSFAPIVIWVWIVIELINGIGHPLWSISQADYTPGVASAVILLPLSIYLARLMLRKSQFY